MGPGRPRYIAILATCGASQRSQPLLIAPNTNRVPQDIVAMNSSDPTYNYQYDANLELLALFTYTHTLTTGTHWLRRGLPQAVLSVLYLFELKLHFE